jgi:DNA-binding LacI/PurR family transcriptional regulator
MEHLGPVVVVLDHDNGYQTSLLEGIRGVLLPLGIPLVVYANDSFAHELRPPVKHLLRLPGVQGVITTILTDSASEADVTATLALTGLASVRIGAVSTNGWSIGTDNAIGMRELMRHLLDDVGAKGVAIVRGINHHPDAREREEIVRAELAARGLHVAFVLDGGFDRDVAYTSTSRLLKNGAVPEVFVALNDRSAVGVMDALADAGLRVPDDVMVTGFDDDAIAQECTPTLTTVRQDLVAQGARAAEMLLAQIGGATPPGHVAYPSTLTIRGSTRGAETDADPDVAASVLLPAQSRALAAMDRALALNRAFMACRSIHELLDALSANMLRLRLCRCFVVLNERADNVPDASGVVVLWHNDSGTRATPDADPFRLDDFLPDHLRDEITRGSLMLQPLSVEDRDLGYVLFEEIVPTRFVGEVLRTDLSRAIDSLSTAKSVALDRGARLRP